MAKHLLIGWFLAIPCLTAAAGERPDPFLEYSWSGGLSAYTVKRVRVDAHGAVRVHWETQRNEVFDYEFRLNEDELAGLTALVEAVKFFDLARPSTPLVLEWPSIL